MKFHEAMRALHSGKRVKLDDAIYYTKPSGCIIKEIEGVKMLGIIDRQLQYRDDWEVVECDQEG